MVEPSTIVYGIIGLVVLIFLLSGIRVVRPVERGLIERFGKYNRLGKPGLSWIIPIIDHMYRVNTTERMVDAEKQEIITKDNLNASVDAQVYFKVRPDEQSVKNSVYSVNNHRRQIVQLARTTLRNIVGNLTLTEANGERNKINGELQKTLEAETSKWGIDVVRTELKEIDPPKDVQQAMNQIVKAEKDKESAKDFATATETRADGEKRAAIKEAEGNRQAAVLEAKGKQEAQVAVAKGRAEAIKLVNESADKYFKGNAQVLKKLETTQASFEHNSKIVVPSDSDIMNVIGEMSGIPVPKPKKKKK